MSTKGKSIYGLILDERNQQKGNSADQQYFYLNHESAGLQYQVKFVDAQKLGIELDYISIKRNQSLEEVAEINEMLSVQAQKIQESVTFLLEDFKLLELDKQNKRAQLRSYPPYADDDAKYYYEIVLDEGNAVHFQRYQFIRQEKRYAKITSQLTAETFERLIDSLSDLLDS